MNPTQDLFQLIKSLSKAEKRYIKLSATKKSNGSLPDYIVLFDAIDKQTVYDETALKKSFSNLTFIKRLPETKYYLYETILKNLRTYYTNNSIDMKLRVLLDSADLLLQKKLYTQSISILEKASKLASFHGRHLMLLEVIEMETKLFAVTKNTKGLEKLMKQTDQGNLLNKHVNALQYNIMAERYYVYQSTYFLTRNQSAFKQLLALPQEPLLADESNALSVQAKQSFYRMYAHYYGAICNYEKAFEARLASAQLIEQYQAYVKHHLDNYKASIYMLLIYAAKAKKKKEFDSYYERFLFTIKKLKKEADLDTVAQSIYLKNHMEIESHHEKQRIRELEKSGILAKYKSYSFKFELTEVYFMESMAVLYFNAANYKECLVWLNKLINKKQSVTSLNNHSFALKLSILVHYELDNFDLLESHIKSVERFLIKHKVYFAFDRLFVATFKKLIKATGKKAQQQLLAGFKEESTLLHENTMEKLAFYYFDYVRWVDKKMSIS